MKTIIKILLITMITAILSQCKKQPESINIKDDNFLNALIELWVDKNSDGIISTGEATEINYLDINSCNISDLKGIEAFVNLDTLYCYFNQLTSLDVSNNIALTGLGCGNNQVTSLNLTNNTAIDYLYLAAMPSLSTVCVGTMPLPPAGITVDTTGSPNVYFTMDCSK